ncbi:MAG: Kelch repeat-containing protein [Thermomicrobiales bacterium]
MRDRVTRRGLIQGIGLAAVSARLPRPAYATSQSAATPSPGVLVWHAIAPLPTARSETPGVTLDGLIYGCGGFGGDRRVDRYDAPTNAWTQLEDLPVGVNHPGVAVLDGKVYVAGGYGSDLRALDHLWVYDPTVKAWQPGASLPVALGAFGMAPVAGKLYAVGGAKEGLGGPVSGAVSVYDPAADAWSDGPEMLTPREHLAVVASQDKIYAVGGRANGSEDDQFAAANEVLDPVGGQWSTLPPLPVPRGGLHGAFAVDTVIVAGGERGDKAFADVNQYDPAADQWRALPKLTVARHGMPLAAIGSTIYAIAGSIHARSADNIAESQAMVLK